MSEHTREQRIQTLKATQQARKKETITKVNKAIERLQRIGAKINFQSIAREANVSVPYLYKYPELKERIQNLRHQQTLLPSAPVNLPPVTAKAHSQVITRLKKRIHQLEEENKELKRKNEALAGQVYRVHSLTEQIERQKEIIATLESRITSFNEQKAETKVIALPSKSKAQISEFVKEELENLGIHFNTTLVKKIKAAPEKQILEAIEALKDQLLRGEVKNPGGWLASAIENGWTKSSSIPKKESVSPPITVSSLTPPNDEVKEVIKTDTLIARLKQLRKLGNNQDD
ncbi:MAG: DUF6262 family protein [Crinalium sp.]